MESVRKTVILDYKKILLGENFDRSIFDGISWSHGIFQSHHDIAATLKNKHPYMITVLIESLNPKLWNKKEYVKKTKVPMVSRFRKLLYDEFFKEFRDREGNILYGEWLERYRSVWQKEQKYGSVDDYIVEHEFEPRYKQKILSRFRNYKVLFGKRFRIERNRYYNLPEPLNYLDYRNPYDNIFIWQENDLKVARRGGSGASGSRGTNSKFIYGL